MILALFLGSFVGLALGLTGGGGSILAVPLLVYGLGFDLQQAAGLSLGVVFGAALFGALLRRKEILWAEGAILGLGGILGIPLGSFLGAKIPKESALILFSGLMLFIALTSISPRSLPQAPNFLRCYSPRLKTGRISGSCAGKLSLAGALSGILSGLFGVGGGFLLTPALILVARAPIGQAAATSLASIVIIAATGFFEKLSSLVGVPPLIPIIFFSGAALGIAVALSFKNKVSERTLQVVFGAAVLAAAVYVLFKNL